MSAIRLVFGVLATLLVSLSYASDESVQETIDQANSQFRQTMGEIGDFVQDVTFNEDDIKSIIKHRGAVEAMDNDRESGDFQDSEDQDVMDFDELINDPAYVSWAESEGLNPGLWMKKFMRVQIMLMKDELAANTGNVDTEMAEQLAELEAQREQMGEAMYTQMKQLLTMSAQSMHMLSDSYGNLPDATPAEKQLLLRYRDQLIDL